MSGILLLAILLPSAGAALIWASAEGGRQPARLVALATSLATLGLAAWLIAEYPAGAAERYVQEVKWLSVPEAQMDVRLSLGLDGLSLWMFGLTALLMVTSVLVSWEAIGDRAPGFYCLLMVLETGMLGVFAARDLILFYVFFEFTLIPLYFLIGIWGSEERRYAANKFFLFTFAGSVITFLGLLSIVWWNYKPPHPMTFSIPELVKGLTDHPMDVEVQVAVFIALFIGFAIKVPLFPLHTWLPLAHVQAPTAGSVILAGVLLKIGTYGFVRFSLPMLPDATALLMPYVLWLSVAGIIYGALVALVQTDVKRLVAYSSVSHLGFCMLGIFALNRLGVEGGVLQMINHGLSTGGLFAVVGMIYERYHTREIKQFSGLAKRLPLLSVCLMVLVFSSIGLPGLNGFAGEFLLLVGMFQRGFAESSDWQLRAIAVTSVLGVVLGAWYMLWLVERMFFGPLREPEHDPSGSHAADLSAREFLALAPLFVFIFWIGLAPEYFLSRMRPTLNALAAEATQRADEAARSDAVASRLVQLDADAASREPSRVD